MMEKLTSGAALQMLAVVIVMIFFAPASHAEGDPEQGKVLAYTCLGCHGIPSYRNQYPSYRVPRLGGQHATYITIALRAYRSGERSHPTMQANASTLSDQDMEDIAAYFASFGGPEEGAVVTAGVAAGKEKAQTCVACHGEKGLSTNEMWPNLAGQHEDYLANALKQYRLANAEDTDGYSVRKNAVMAGLAAGLSDEDIELLAGYFSAQVGLYTTEHQ